jgi:hypothetical protein
MVLFSLTAIWFFFFHPNLKSRAVKLIFGHFLEGGLDPFAAIRQAGIDQIQAARASFKE